VPYGRPAILPQPFSTYSEYSNIKAAQQQSNENVKERDGGREEVGENQDAEGDAQHESQDG
jgi:hypothetical protein